MGHVYERKTCPTLTSSGPLAGSRDNVESPVTVCFGYRADEYEELARRECVSDAVKLHMKLIDSHGDRPVVAVSLGAHVSGVVLPHADPSDPSTLAAGVSGRMAKKMPPVKNRWKILKEIREDTEELIKRMGLKPLDSEAQFFTWEVS